MTQHPRFEGGGECGARSRSVAGRGSETRGEHQVGARRGDKGYNLQRSGEIDQMGSGLPRHVPAAAHDWGQVLTFQGKNGSGFRSFTNWVKHRQILRYHVGNRRETWESSMMRAGVCHEIRPLMPNRCTFNANQLEELPESSTEARGHLPTLERSSCLPPAASLRTAFGCTPGDPANHAEGEQAIL